MPRLINKVPAHRLHWRSGQAVVALHGKDVYLGRYGCPESHQRYNNVIAEWLAVNRRLLVGSINSADRNSIAQRTFFTVSDQNIGQLSESEYDKR